MNLLLTYYKKHQTMIWLWMAGWALFSTLIMALFPSFTEREEELEEFLMLFPEGILEAFSFDVTLITLPEGFFIGEALTFYLLATLILVSYQTVNFLSTQHLSVILVRPIRKSVVLLVTYVFISLEWLILNVSFIIATVIAIGLFVGWEDITWSFWLLLLLGMQILGMAFLAVVVCLTTIFSKSTTLAIASIYPIVAIVIEGISSLDEVPQWVQYTSMNHYLAAVELVQTNELQVEYMLLLVGVIIAMILLSLYLFARRDIDI